MHVKELDRLIKKTKENLSDLLTERESRTTAPFVKCIGNVNGKGCGKKNRVDKLTYIQTHWYTGPSGCMEGDYWNQGEGKFVCPKCGHLNRSVCREDDFSVHKRKFGEIVDTY